MRITAINNNFTNSKKTNHNLATAPNIARTKSSVNFTGTDKFIGQINKEYLNTFLEYCKKIDRVKLTLRGDGNEQGLNRVVGLTSLKSGLYQDVLMPLMDVMDGKPKHYLVPNGIHFFGPMGVGKTYVAQQLGEHYYQKGGIFQELGDELTGNIATDIAYINHKFAEGEYNFEKSDRKKYTVFLIDSIDSVFRGDCIIPVKDKLAELAKKSRNRGIILLTTSDYLEKTDPRILTGKNRLRIPLSYVPEEDIVDFIHYYIKKDKLPFDIIDYKRIIDAVKDKALNFRPKDIECNLAEACYNLMGTSDKISTSEALDALLKGRHTINPDDAKRWISMLEQQKVFANKLGGVYEY